MFLCNAVYTFLFVPFFRAPLWALNRRAWLWTGGGALLLALNNAGIAVAISVWKSPITVNVVYSIRGLLSVGFVWTVGHWFANEEQHLAPRVFRVRLIGAAQMLGGDPCWCWVFEPRAPCARDGCIQSTGMTQPPPIDGILESILYVDDLPRAVAFYRDELGFAPMTGDPARFQAFSVGGRQVLACFSSVARRSCRHRCRVA